MPITYHLKLDERLLVIVHEGVVSDDEFLAFYKALYEDSRIDKSLNLLVDLRHTKSSGRSGPAVRELAHFMEGRFINIPARPKIAVVAPKDVSFGMARMYDFFSRYKPWDFVVFRAADAALAWLGLPENLLNNLDYDVLPEGIPHLK
jgi:hypothetical protein